MQLLLPSNNFSTLDVAQSEWFCLRGFLNREEHARNYVGVSREGLSERRRVEDWEREWSREP